MSRSHNLKAQVAESSEQQGSVISVLVEANEDVVDLKVFLGKLEENCKTVFAPFGQSPTRDFDVDTVVIQHGSPADVFGIRQPGLDV